MLAAWIYREFLFWGMNTKAPPSAVIFRLCREVGAAVRFKVVKDFNDIKGYLCSPPEWRLSQSGAVTRDACPYRYGRNKLRPSRADAGESAYHSIIAKEFGWMRMIAEPSA